MKVEVIANTKAGIDALKIHQKEEERARKKMSKVPKWMRSKDVKAFLDMESEFIEDLDKGILTHRISNFVGNTENHKIVFKNGVVQAMFDNGAGAKDYEVKFYD